MLHNVRGRGRGRDRGRGRGRRCRRGRGGRNSSQSLASDTYYWSSEDMMSEFSASESSPTSSSSSSQAMFITPKKKPFLVGSSSNSLPPAASNNVEIGVSKDRMKMEPMSANEYYSISSSSSSPSPSSPSSCAYLPSSSSPSSSFTCSEPIMFPPTKKPTVRSTEMSDVQSGERRRGGGRGGRGRGRGGGRGINRPLRVERSLWKRTSLRSSSKRGHLKTRSNGIHQQGFMASGDLPCRSIACFFKLILEPRLDLQRLVIPQKFMYMHGNDLSNIIFLRIPTGKVWRFELLRQDGNALVQADWPKFVKFYSLSHGSTMMFQYLGSSQFDVVIHDMSTCEIDYPISKKEKRAKKANLPQQKRPCAGRPPKWDPDSEAVKAAEDYRSAHADVLSFVIVLTAGYINRNVINIPLKFVISHMRGNDNERPITLQVSGSQWRVKMIKYHYDCPNCKLTQGVKAFIKCNNIQKGDACVFELVTHDTFKVQIFRAKYFGS